MLGVEFDWLYFHRERVLMLRASDRLFLPMNEFGSSHEDRLKLIYWLYIRNRIHCYFSIGRFDWLFSFLFGKMWKHKHIYAIILTFYFRILYQLRIYLKIVNKIWICNSVDKRWYTANLYISGPNSDWPFDRLVCTANGCVCGKSEI